MIKIFPINKNILSTLKQYNVKNFRFRLFRFCFSFKSVFVVDNKKTENKFREIVRNYFFMKHQKNIRYYFNKDNFRFLFLIS